MRRKNLWTRISYVTVSGILASAMPIASAAPAVIAADAPAAVSEEGSGTTISDTEQIDDEGDGSGSISETDPPQTDPPQTDPPQTDPPQTDPPQTDPPQTDPPQTDPPQTDPPQTDPPQTEPQQTEPPATESTAPETQVTETPATEPVTETQATEPSTLVTQPETEPAATETQGQTTEVPTEPVTETSSDSELQTETGSVTKPKKEGESESESEEIEDHSILNANWETNIIASNAAYLGQLSSAYGISISGDFYGVCAEVEAEFASTLTDPENFHATNWRDVLGVFIYELKERTGSGNISADSKKLLLKIFKKMNAPKKKKVPAIEVPDISEIFVEEYPIDEQLAAIDRQEEIMLAMNDASLGDMDVLADVFIRENADASRAALREEQKAQMDAARYEKWLRMKQEIEARQVEAEQEITYSAAETVSRTIGDYVKMKGLSAGAAADMQRYASVECLQLCAIASADPTIVRASVGNSVSEQRVRIVAAAYSLVGKVGYFWGGKSFTFGWDPRWGSPATVTAEGSTSSGMTRNYGLDCSGFTLYCYYNGLGGGDAGIGGHTTSQWNASVMVDQAQAQPGDLVFYGGPERGDNNHVGLVVGKSSDGGLIVAHCSSSRNGVVVGEAWSSGFRYVRTVPSLG